MRSALLFTSPRVCVCVFKGRRRRDSQLGAFRREIELLVKQGISSCTLPGSLGSESCKDENYTALWRPSNYTPQGWRQGSARWLGRGWGGGGTCKEETLRLHNLGIVEEERERC